MTLPGKVRWHDGSLPAPEWERAVAAAVASIKAGRLRKTVLSRDLYATASADLDARALLHRLAARYPDCYTFACGGLVGATPELLIRREAAEISALVLAGTTPRGKDAAEDEALGAALLSSAKNTEEHAYAATGVRDVLAPLCDRLTVDSAPFLLRLANVQHLATAVTGTLAAGRTPAAVTGRPVRACHRSGAASHRRGLRHADRCRAGGYPRTRGHGPGPLRRPVGWVDAAATASGASRCAAPSSTAPALGCSRAAG